MKKYLLVAAIASGLVMLSGVATVSADENLQKLSVTQLDDVNAAGYYRKRYYRMPTASAKAHATADAFGKYTTAKSRTASIADANAGYSGSMSGSHATASGVWCGACASVQ